MPEIKHNFTGGKMNKDLDERLVPNGEYTDAMNIQVSTSEGSDVGTVQNILGNRKMQNSSVNSAVEGGVVVCSIADEKNDRLYYFVWTPNVDYIFEYSRETFAPIPVFVDKNKNALKFRKDIIITGVNIIDDMLFWTDNNSEPKKINIPRCKEGTPNITTHTKLINESQGLTGVDIEEKHITVIRKAPRKPLDMVVNTSRDPQKIYTGVIETSLDPLDPNSFPNPTMSNFSGLDAENNNIFNIRIGDAIDGGGNEIPIGNINDNNGLTGWHIPNPGSNGVQNNIKLGTKIVFKPYDDDGEFPGLPVTDYIIKGVVEDSYPSDDNKNTWSDGITVKIISIDGFPPAPGASGLKWVVDLWDEEERLFEFKFPRFSYRYKFEDGEYSAFAPFTQVAFSPGSFDYHPRKGYNLGMTNRASNIHLGGIVTRQTPEDVVAIDILFKDETSPNIYIVDTVRPDEYAASGSVNRWNSLLGDWKNNVGSLPYIIEREQVESVVPSNQLLRPWDNVPRKALAQDVTGNRIVYANYLQNYNLQTTTQEKYVPNFTVSFNHAELTYFHEDTTSFPTIIRRVNTSETAKSIKSLREYQLGVVFTDKYGRETPVISNTSATKSLEKLDADKANSISVMLNDFASRPEGLTHLKFYVKETAGEYYNMAMDRFYDAEDGNVWLAFPSSDRNKIDIDTFLILKKGSDQDTLVTAAARYKVIAIENEAPDFIKTTRVLAAQQKHKLGKDLFTNSGVDLPVIGNKSFRMTYSPWGSGPGRDLDKVTDSRLYIEFSDGNQFSDRYRIQSISHDDLNDGGEFPLSSPSMYSIQLDKILGDDVNFISNDPTGQVSTSINMGTIVNIYKYTVENSPKFDGRFFVKIYEDETFTSNITESVVEEDLEYRIVASKKIYSMFEKTEHLSKHWAQTKQILSNDFGKLTQLTNSFSIKNIYTTGDYANAMAFGYYYYSDFASMATYFRKYRLTKGSSWSYNHANVSGSSTWEVRHLTKGTSGNFDIEYPQGTYWVDHTNWATEFGADPNISGGYTARWNNHPLSGGGNVNSGSSEFDIYTERDYMGADDPIDTDVWFIDAGPAVAKRTTSDHLLWAYLSGTYDSINDQGIDNWDVTQTGEQDMLVNPGGHVNQRGLRSDPNNDQWHMQLSYGGIFGATEDFNDNANYQLNGPEKFFNTGFYGSDVNPYYVNNPKNTSFALSLQPGSKFRWREDPTKTEYIVGIDIPQQRLLRHSSRKAETENATTTGYVFNYGTLPTVFQGAAVSAAENLSFNFTSGVDCRKITPALKWNPMEVGQITEGFIIKLPAADMFGSTTGNAPTISGSQLLATNLSIYVETLKGDNSGGGDDEASIMVGMALWKYYKAGPGGSADQLITANNTDADQTFLVVREIRKKSGYYELLLGGYTGPLTSDDHLIASDSNLNPKIGTNYTFVQVGMNGYSHNSEFNINTISRNNHGAIGAVGYHLDFIKPIEPEAILSENPAIWETEPKETKDLDIYYEASPTIPVTINASNVHDAVPVGSLIQGIGVNGGKYFLVIDHDDTGGIIVVEGSGGYGSYSQLLDPLTNPSGDITITRPDGLSFKIQVTSKTLITINTNDYSVITLDEDLYTKEFTIPYHNCYSFGNGVESNRIRDNFNLPYISNGVRVSTTLEEEYKEERRKYGLIYSGIYHSTGGINNLNQFIQAEKITKDINPIYGSIQKLHSRDTDLVTLCEDKCLRILANKDAVYNADGNPNLTATQNVLGQTVPFSGEYGISTNPESFASEAYRAYFTDRVRGTVMRLSKDGLTPISNHGMKDWFKDNLKLNNTAFGSYDDKKEEYNLTLSNRLIQNVRVLGNRKGTGTPWEAGARFETISTALANAYSVGDPIYANGIPAGTTVVNKVNMGGGIWRITLSNTIDHTLLGDFSMYGDVNSPIATWWMTVLGDSTLNDTISFKENVRGWVSFKSFLPENALSMGNDYYTFKNGNLWRHHEEHPSFPRNTFYDPADWDDENNYTSSSVEVVLNDSPSSIKDFHTLNYEGSQSKIERFASDDIGDGTLVLPYQPTTTYTDQDYYNLSDKLGWYVEGIYTDKEEGYIKEFLEKEGKWYNNINRTIDTSLEKADTSDFTFQGIGTVQIAGCTNPIATNYNPNATVDDGSCMLNEGPLLDFDFTDDDSNIYGCTDPAADNYNAAATYDDGSCTYTPIPGCTDPSANNYDPNATVDDGSCTYKGSTPGCTDPSAINYNPLANSEDGSCIYREDGGGDNNSGGDGDNNSGGDSKNNGDGGGDRDVDIDRGKGGVKKDGIKTKYTKYTK